MTLVRKRRHQQALRLSLPPPPPPSSTDDFHSPPPQPVTPPTSPDIIENLSDLKKLAVLGHGNGGTVYKVHHQRSSSIYALKVLRFNNQNNNNAAAPMMISHQAAAREAEILKRVDSQFIVKCHAVFHTISGGGELCFVMEHMEGGSLYEALRAHEKLSEDVISRVAQCVLKGLQYLHGMKIVHGDIKPSNLLINAKGEIKIADFGVSRIVGSGNVGNASCEGCMGTCAYMSPERVDPERWDGDDNADGFAGDVWSVGVVVLECLVGHYPLIGMGEKPDWAALIWGICFGERLEIPESASPEFRSFVWRCLEKDWRKRGSVEELLQHPFVNNRCFTTSCASATSNHGLLDFAFHA
ncbi:hypothetical protein LWI29_008502 [Acer saccharum]|uniref:Protein kinase domain-containing protein n=1 Tax=Acer saccharum TaxID=4024 RepID=A0AA39VKE3_ACESA|nr:hypothetical protein LWI29_008502 [Acer saccharum]